MYRPLAVVALVAASLAGRSAQANDQLVNLAKILFKIASYDGNLPADTIPLAVVYPAAHKAEAQAALAVFTALSKIKLNGRAITVLDLPYASTGELAGKLGAAGAYGAFIPALVPDKDQAGVLAALAAARLFSFAERPELVGRGAIASVREEQGGKRTILLNLKAATAAGRQFDGALIKICEVVQ